MKCEGWLLCTVAYLLLFYLVVVCLLNGLDEGFAVVLPQKRSKKRALYYFDIVRLFIGLNEGFAVRIAPRE